MSSFAGEDGEGYNEHLGMTNHANVHQKGSAKSTFYWEVPRCKLGSLRGSLKRMS